MRKNVIYNGGSKVHIIFSISISSLSKKPLRHRNQNHSLKTQYSLYDDEKARMDLVLSFSFWTWKDNTISKATNDKALVACSH